MADILSLVPSCGTVAPKDTIADDLRTLADSIESGELEDVATALLILNCGGQVVSIPVGRVMSSLEAIGMLEYAKSGMMWGEDD